MNISRRAGAAEAGGSAPATGVMAVTSCPAPPPVSLSPAAALARHDHRYWHWRYREHLESSPFTLCGCQDGGRLCPDGQRCNDEADDAGRRWQRAEGRA
jgi:hypothetical protein